MKKTLSFPLPYLIFLTLTYLTLAFVQMQDFANDPGVGWHLKTGQYILTTGHIPRSDLFTFAKELGPWVSDQWLSDVVLYLTYSFGGWPLLYAILTVVYLFTFFFLLYRTLGKYVEGEMSVLFACLFALKVATVQFVLRPVIFSFLFFCITLAVVQSILSIKKISRLQWIGLPVLFLVWANMHPSFMLGLAVLCIAWFQPIIERFFMGLTPPKRLVDKLVLLTGVCLMLTIINPYGVELHRSVWTLGTSKYFMSLNQEWQPLRDSASLEIMLLGIFLGTIVTSSKSKLFTWFEVFSLIVFTHLAFGATRFAPYFALVAALPFAKACTSLAQFIFIEKVPLLAFLISSPSEETRNRRRTGSVMFLILATFLLIYPVVSKQVPGFDGPFGPGPAYPYGAVQYLLQNTEGKTVNVLSHPDWGGFITWAGNGKLKPYIDDRNTLHGEKAYKEFFQKFRPGSEWKEYVLNSGANYVLLSVDDTLVPFLEKYERIVPLFRDEKSVIFAVPQHAE